jgi:hypothetical protein
MVSQSDIYLESIFIILNGLDPLSLVQLKDDIRLKLQHPHEFGITHTQALHTLETIMEVREHQRLISARANKRLRDTLNEQTEDLHDSSSVRAETA